MNQDYLYAMEDVAESMASAGGVSSLVSLLAYVFSALAIYTIAQRRQIKNAWMAWVPVLNLWILGSISDQYRYVVKGEVKNKRKVLLGLQIAIVLCTCAAFAKVLSTVISLATSGNYMDEMEILRQVFGSMASFAPVVILSLVRLVFEIMALYDVYTSCEPVNNVLYLVLSVIPAISQITRPLFLFLCRDKDEGMPPRREENV